jgi:hypothetical protein
MDKEFWQELMKNDYAIPDGHTVDELTAELFSYLDNTDPELRDDIGYIVYANWLNKGLYSQKTISAHITELLQNLENGIGENGTDSVFPRTFSVLFLSEIVHNDNKNPRLDEATIHTLLEKGLWYLAAEKDVRGRINDEKGWAHSAAHTADLLNVLAKNQYTGKNDLQRILNAIADKMLTTHHYIYCHDEDERLVSAVISALERNLLEMDFLKTWLDRTANPDFLPTWKEMFSNEETCTAHLNTKTFLRSLHFRLLICDSAPGVKTDLLPEVLKAVRAVTAWY